jgi:hypothetical protein
MEQEQSQVLNWDDKKTDVLQRFTLPILTACPDLIGKHLSGGEAAREIIAFNDALVADLLKD